jgi:hypothetical protein
MRRPLKKDINASDEWYFRFKAHAPNDENTVTVRVTESERDGKLIVDLDSIEGDVSVRRHGLDEEVERLRAALRRCGSDAIGDNSTLAARIHMHVKNALEDES